MAVVIETSTGEELVRATRTVAIDVAILDARMPPTFLDEGLRAAQRLRAESPAIGILILSTYAETPYATEVLDLPPSGGRGYLVKDRVSDLAILVDALNRLHRGEALIDPGIAADLVSGRRKLEVLTDQERRVLQEMAAGQSNAGIARALNLSSRTVEDYCARIFDKLGVDIGPDVNRRVNAVLQYLRNS